MILLALWACGTGATDGDTRDVPCLERDPVVTIGTGAYEWEDLADGDPLTMVHGPQGGWHMLGSMRVTSMVQVVEVHYTITTESGALVCDQLYRVATVAEGECQGAYTGMYGYLDVNELKTDELDTPPEVLAGQTLTLAMDVVDTEDRAASASIDVIATLDPADQDTDLP